MGLKQQALSGVKWNIAITIITTLLQIVQVGIIARYISRADFGLLAIVYMVLGFTGLFADLGLTIAMLSKQNITVKQYSSIYWFNWILNGTIFLVICGIAPFIAMFYKDPRIIHLTILMALGMLIAPFGKVFQTIKTKNLEFGFLSVVNIINRFVAFGAIAIMAVMGFGIYSLIFSALISSAFNAIIFSIAGRKECKIEFHFNLKEIKDFFTIGLYSTGSQILDYFSYKIDILLIGRFFGMENLGIYNLGKELVLKPMKLINPIITGVATPLFSKIQDDAELLKSSYIKVLNILSFTNFPILAMLFALAEPAVRLQYGPKLIDVEFFVKVLSLWGMFATIGNPAGVLQVAKGRTDLGFKWTLIRLAFAPLAIFIASFFSIKAVAYSQVILQIFFFYIYWRLLIYPLSAITLREYIGSFKNAMICSFIGIAVLLGFNHYLHINYILHLIICSAVFVAIYGLTTFILNKEAIHLFRSLVLKKKQTV